MAKNDVGSWSATASNNTDVGGINIAEGCAAANLNNALREIMAQFATLAPKGTTALDADYQAKDANLTSLSGLTLAANKGLYSTAADTLALFDLTAAGRALLGDADAAAQRVTLGVPDVIDEDDFATDSATRPPSQQSTKAYVDAEVAGAETLAGTTWQNMAGSRSAGTTYQNTTGGPILVSLSWASGTFSVSTDNVTFVDIAYHVPGSNGSIQSSAIMYVGPDEYYKTTAFAAWRERR